MNQLPLQRRKVRQTLQNLMLFATPNLTCQTKLIQTPLFCRPELISQVRRLNGAAFGTDLIWHYFISTTKLYYYTWQVQSQLLKLLHSLWRVFLIKCDIARLTFYTFFLFLAPVITTTEGKSNFVAYHFQLQCTKWLSLVLILKVILKLV